MNLSAKEFNKLYGSNFKMPKKNKFGNTKVNINNEIFDSKLEGKVYCDLLLRQRSGEIKTIEKQVKTDLISNGLKLSMYYKPDFVLTYHNGVKEFLEVKSFITQTDVWKLKWQILQSMYQKEVMKGEVLFTVALSTKFGYEFIHYENLKKIK